MGIRPHVKYTAREDRTILSMVSKGLGISLLPELMVRHSPYPVTACRPPMTFHRSIGIGVKDEKALSSSTPPIRGLRAALGGGERGSVRLWGRKNLSLRASDSHGVFAAQKKRPFGVSFCICTF